MAIVGPHHPVLKEICEALGLRQVKSLKLIMEACSSVRVETEFYPEDENLEKLVPILKRYNLVEEESTTYD